MVLYSFQRIFGPPPRVGGLVLSGTSPPAALRAADLDSICRIPRGRPILQMTFLTVWTQDFQKSDRLPAPAVEELIASGAVKPAWKPNRKGKLKPVLVVLGIEPKYRDLSCQMGPAVIEGNAFDYEYHQAIVAEWGKHRYRFA